MNLYFQGIRVTLKKGFGSFNVACNYQEKELGWAPEEPWFILTNLESLAAAMTAYRKRFDIEISHPQCPHRSEMTDRKVA
jgi:hypothetical protein